MGVLLLLHSRQIIYVRLEVEEKSCSQYAIRIIDGEKVLVERLTIGDCF